LPFPDGSIGAVICSYVLQVIADPVAVLSEIRRVLGAGGVALVETPMRRASSTEVRADHQNRVFWQVKTLASRLPGAVRRYDPGWLRSQLGAGGLIVCEERTLTRSCAALARPTNSRPQTI
jgi:SAM-dependent methyltransferase